VKVPGVGICGRFSDQILVSGGVLELDPLDRAQQVAVQPVTSLEGLSHLLAVGLDHAERLRHGDVCLAATLEGRAVGLYWLNYGTQQDLRLGDTRSSSRYVYANQLLVDAQRRGHGIGTALAMAASRHARQQADRNVVCAVPVGNQASLVTHTAAGFVDRGIVRGLRFGERYVRFTGGIQACLR
jgi:GNAT superfamily N-acetyltransferase